MGLDSLSQIAQILGSISVVFAIVFGVAQLRAYRQQRRDGAAMELMRSFQDAEFTHAFTLINGLPDGIQAAEFCAKGRDCESAALTIGIKFETVGLLVYRETIPFPIVEELVGGIAVSLWEKIGPWARDIRESQRQPRFMEWYEWLADQLVDSRRGTPKPAHTEHRDGRPRS